MADLKHQVPIDAAAAKVYQAVATQNGMRHWWTADSQMEEKAGGKAPSLASISAAWCSA